MEPDTTDKDKVFTGMVIRCTQFVYSGPLFVHCVIAQLLAKRHLLTIISYRVQGSSNIMVRTERSLYCPNASRQLQLSHRRSVSTREAALGEPKLCPYIP